MVSICGKKWAPCGSASCASEPPRFDPETLEEKLPSIKNLGHVYEVQHILGFRALSLIQRCILYIRSRLVLDLWQSSGLIIGSFLFQEHDCPLIAMSLPRLVMSLH
jgi:hypothetical protein